MAACTVDMAVIGFSNTIYLSEEVTGTPQFFLLRNCLETMFLTQQEVALLLEV